MSFSWTSFLKQAETWIPVAMYFVPGGALPAAAVQVATALPSIISDIETTMDPGTSGSVKKQAAMIAAKQVTQTIAAASTGGQAATWNDISGKVGTLVDSLVAAANQAAPTIPTAAVQSSSTEASADNPPA
jgi:hypothetical protein